MNTIPQDQQNLLLPRKLEARCTTVVNIAARDVKGTWRGQSYQTEANLIFTSLGVVL